MLVALVVALLAAVGHVPAASAQSQATTGVIRGVAAQADGGPTTNAVVTLRHRETNVSRTLRTSERGLFVATLLPLGRYEVTVPAVGFDAVSCGDIVVRVGQVVESSFALERRVTALAAVNVTDKTRTPVNTSRTELSSTLSEAAVKSIPNNGRNFLSLIIPTVRAVSRSGRRRQAEPAPSAPPAIVSASRAPRPSADAPTTA
jgi:hypothetical protein